MSKKCDKYLKISYSGRSSFHKSNRYGLFAPTIAEVLAQIPSEYFDKVVAFEVLPVSSPYPREHGFFEAKVILYRKSKKK